MGDRMFTHFVQLSTPYDECLDRLLCSDIDIEYRAEQRKLRSTVKLLDKFYTPPELVFGISVLKIVLDSGAQATAS